MLNIKIPSYCQNEQCYALDIILGEFLGLKFNTEVHGGKYIEITSSMDNISLTLDTTFFYKAKDGWLKSHSMPDLPLEKWRPSADGINANLVEQDIPVLYGKPGLLKKENQMHINVDIFGSAFFMLSRYEELITNDRDNHDRFPATASVAFKEDFLQRPIVNEYIEILLVSLNQLWPDLKVRERKSSNFITCDVDWPFDPAIYSLNQAIKKVARLLIKEKKPLKAILAGVSYLLAKLGFKVKDTYREAIHWMMDINEKVGNRIAFYFIMHNTSKSDTVEGEDYNSPEMRGLFREIFDRGHEIGVHPGYETYNNPENFRKSIDELKRILNEEGLEQENIGGRQHFLRWDTSQTPHLWEKNGMSYDSTLSFADKAGFRCGVCFDFTMYDLINRKALSLKQKPLIVMECSIIASRYEDLGYSSQAMQRFSYFKEVSHQFNGTFNLLWHNSHFENREDKEFYQKLIQ